MAAESPAEDANVGRVLAGQYRVDALLGEGGMGAVYRGVQLSVGRPVAIKVIAGAVAQNPECIKRFRREAEAMGRLRHPNTVRLFDFGAEHGELFMVMELLDGEDLAGRLERGGPLALREALDLMRQTLLALSEAHALGIVHRDLKPANVFLARVEGGQVFAKVMDFGIAGIEQGAAQTKLTLAGAVLGTPAYMSPEQAQGAQVDARSDLYSLGIMLFEMLTGQTPFAADSVVSLLLAHVSKAPPKLVEVAPDLAGAADVQELLSALLAKRADDRPSSAADVLGRVAALEKRLGSALDAPPSRTALPARTAPLSRPPEAVAPASTRAYAPARLPLWLRSSRARWIAAAALAVALTAPFLFGGSRVEQAPASSPKAVAPALYTVHVASSPSGAKVLLEGVELGATPYALEVRRETTVMLALPGYATRSLTVTPESEPNVAVELEPLTPHDRPAAARTGARAPLAETPSQAAAAEEPPRAQSAAASNKPIPWLKNKIGNWLGVSEPAPRATTHRATYGDVASAKRAYRAGALDKRAYEENIRALKLRRASRIEAERAQLDNGAITRDEYKRRAHRIDVEYEGR